MPDFNPIQPTPHPFAMDSFQVSLLLRPKSLSVAPVSPNPNPTSNKHHRLCYCIPDNLPHPLFYPPLWPCTSEFVSQRSGRSNTTWRRRWSVIDVLYRTRPPEGASTAPPPPPPTTSRPRTLSRSQSGCVHLHAVSPWLSNLPPQPTRGVFSVFTEHFRFGACDRAHPRGQDRKGCEEGCEEASKGPRTADRRHPGHQPPGSWTGA